MNRRTLLHSWISGAACLGLLGFSARGWSQESVGRATIGGEAASHPRPQGAQRPSAGSIEVTLPAELEALLLEWEQRSSEIEKLRGTFMRYIYDSVFLVEKRARGRFWYQSPDQGRMDFHPEELPDPPINPEKRGGPNDEPYRIETEERQRWICTGEEVYIIYDDQQMFDRIQIPPQQQGRNIVNGPLPFLFGMKAEQAKERYHLSLGSQHWPEGGIVEQDGQRLQFPPQVHVVAIPKYEVDAREWQRAEVLLDAETFLPRAIRLIDPTGNKETVYVFDSRSMRLNEALPWFPSPFNDRPPRNYTLGHDSRAAGDETPPTDPGIVPAAGEQR